MVFGNVRINWSNFCLMNKLVNKLVECFGMEYPNIKNRGGCLHLVFSSGIKSLIWRRCCTLLKNSQEVSHSEESITYASLLYLRNFCARDIA